MMTTAAEFIAKFEGFAGRAYWDVNAWRLGYGSDTEGPDQIPVVEGMTTTKERALQNLAMRIPEFQRTAIHGTADKKYPGIGEAVWDELTENPKTAVTSLVYNYGHLPRSVVVDPTNPAKTSSEIRALQTANGGVNAKRRNIEADFYLAGAAAPKPDAPPPAPRPVPIPSPWAPGSIPPATAGRLDVVLNWLIEEQTAYRAATPTPFDESISSLQKLEAQASPVPLQIHGAAPAPAATQHNDNGVTMQTILLSIFTNWATTAFGTVAGGPALIDLLQNPANWKQDISGVATLILGWLAKDSWVTGGVKPATPEARKRVGS